MLRPALLTLLLLPALAGAGDARLLTMDTAEPLAHPVLGLQRSAVPLPAGFALDTSLLADLALAANLGVRWAHAEGLHRFVVGARYTHFLGGRLYSDAISAQEPRVTRFEATLSGPSAYALYGVALGEWLLQVEARYAHLQFPSGTLLAGASLPLGADVHVALEAGAQLVGRPGFRGAAGLRYTGRNLGLTLGAAYVDLQDPLLPGGALPVLPVVNLSWTFR